jgi:hypothetical protein
LKQKNTTMSTLTNGNDEGIDLNGKASLQQDLTEEELDKQKLMQEYREELAKIQEDIATLKMVLNDKLKREHELKALLGITFVDEMRQDFSEGINTLKSSNAFKTAAQTINDLGSTVSQNEAYQKTTSSIKTATQKITPAFQTIGSTMKTSLSNLGNLRNSSMFKSFEAGISSTLSTGKMKSSKSEYVVDGSEQSGNLPTSRSTLGTTNATNGFSKPDTIHEDK